MARQHRLFEHGIPKRHCIANIIKALDTYALLKALLGWINSRREQAQKLHIAIDGKILRGCWKDNVYNALNVVSAFDVDNGLALYQQAAQNKWQEGQIACYIIDMLVCKDCIVTLDVLPCQRNTLEVIEKNKGDFIMQVKANQRNLHT